MRSTNRRHPPCVASPSESGGRDFTSRKHHQKAAFSVRDVGDDAIDHAIRAADEGLFGETDPRIIEDPSAQVLVRCDDVDGVQGVWCLSVFSGECLHDQGYALNVKIADVARCGVVECSALCHAEGYNTGMNKPCKEALAQEPLKSVVSAPGYP